MVESERLSASNRPRFDTDHSREDVSLFGRRGRDFGHHGASADDPTSSNQPRRGRSGIRLDRLRALEGTGELQYIEPEVDLLELSNLALEVLELEPGPVPEIKTSLVLFSASQRFGEVFLPLYLHPKFFLSFKSELKVSPLAPDGFCDRLRSSCLNPIA